MPGESLAEHTAELWQIMAGVIALLLAILAFTYKGLVLRVKSIETKLTNIVSEDKCKALQGYCPHGSKLNVIASDTTSIKDTLDKVVGDQAVLRQHTLPKEYLTIVNYEKAHIQLERAMEKNMNDIKEILRDMKKELVERQLNGR